MPEFKLIDVEEVPYLYEERTCSMDPADIGQAMGEAFGNVMGFMARNGIAPAGKVLSVYYTYDPERMTFRAGCSVARSDLSKAEGSVKADVTPAGRVLAFTHIGPYARLRESYDAMMGYLAENKLEMRAPSWEVYVNDPKEVPEAELRTDVFVSLA